MTGACPTQNCVLKDFEITVTGGFKNPDYVKPIVANESLTILTKDTSDVFVNNKNKVPVLLSNIPQITTKPLQDVFLTRTFTDALLSTAIDGSVFYYFKFTTTTDIQKGGKIVLTIPND
jgi:hypothetical protein